MISQGFRAILMNLRYEKTQIRFTVKFTSACKGYECLEFIFKGKARTDVSEER